MACLLLACATLTARALDRTFLEGNDVTVDKLTSLSALDVSKMITPSSLDNNGLTASVGVRRNQNLLHGMTFTHDGATGNLLERTGMFSYGEEFAYDDLDRLTSYTGQGGTKYITYEDNGNIQSHTDLGDYEYSQVKPHAVETVGGLLPGLQSAEGSTFTYNGFGKVSSINFSGMSQMSWRRLDFSYGPDRERWKTVRTMRGGLIPGPITTLAIPESSVNYVHTTNLYAGDYERIDGTSYYYLDGGVIYVKPATGAGQAYYALTDHLGSYTRLYTMAGDSVLIASYDPWGNCTTTKNTLSFRRGFTGHEHLTTYGVINMRSAQRDALLAKNGRMYDPTVGRYLAPRLGIWLSPDPMQLKYPHVSSYAYCMGNPLRFTDPEGKKIVNADGQNAVYYSGGNIVFTKYATHDIRRIVNVLNTIPEGRKILRQVINSPTKVRVSISSDTRISGKTYTYGETTQGNWNPNDNYGRYVASDGTYRIKESFVEIFEGTLVEDAKTSNSKHKGLTIDQAIGAVAAHEFIHATDIQEINKDIHSEMKKRVRENREIKPNQIERNVINQFLENRGE